jgi:hypothetical protein
MICQRKQDFDVEMDIVKRDLLSNAFPSSFVDSIIHKWSKTRDLE